MKASSKHLRLGFILLAVTLLAACVSNPYKEFYYPANGLGPDEISSRRISSPPETPEIVRGVDPDSDIKAAQIEGYAFIGSSHFVGPSATDQQLIEQAKVLGADRVLAYGTFKGTTHASVPITMPTSQTSITNANATLYGANGPVTAYGTAQTTTFGSQTTYVPVAVNSYDFLALYLVKIKSALGANFRDVTSEEAQRIGTVNAVSLGDIMRGSPAASAGLLPNDIITKLDEKPVLGRQNLIDEIKLKQNKKVKLTVIRGAKPMLVSVSLGGY